MYLEASKGEEKPKYCIPWGSPVSSWSLSDSEWRKDVKLGKIDYLTSEPLFIWSCQDTEVKRPATDFVRHIKSGLLGELHCQPGEYRSPDISTSLDFVSAFHVGESVVSPLSPANVSRMVDLAIRSAGLHTERITRQFTTDFESES